MMISTQYSYKPEAQASDTGHGGPLAVAAGLNKFQPLAQQKERSNV